jgi:AraC-like DNA-binding protein
MRISGYLLQKSGWKVHYNVGERPSERPVLKLERFEASLHPRIWSFNRAPEQPARQIALLTDGAGEAETGDRRLALEAPAFLWLADPAAGRLRVEAGATGFRGSVPDALSAAAVGEEAESAGVAALAARSFVLSLAGHGEQAAMLERCLALMNVELRAPQTGTPLMLSALLRVVLVAALRVSGGELVGEPAAGQAAGPAEEVLVRFRQLVEINFRNRWTVARYADALGVTPDRLHSLCAAGTGKPPKVLVSERLAQEAALRLEQSAISVQRLAHLLGFGDQAHFSNFFRRMTGMAPSRYRKVRSRAQLQDARPPVNFAEWP